VAELEDESRIERRHWGEIGSDEEESEEEESEEEEDEEGGTGAKAGGGVPGMAPEGGYVTPAPTEGY